jgi:hypothetical protein
MRFRYGPQPSDVAAFNHGIPDCNTHARSVALLRDAGAA